MLVGTQEILETLRKNIFKDKKICLYKFIDLFDSSLSSSFHSADPFPSLGFKKLNLCLKLKFSKSFIFETQIILSDRINRLKYQGLRHGFQRYRDEKIRVCVKDSIPLILFFLSSFIILFILPFSLFTLYSFNLLPLSILSIFPFYL